MVAMMYCMSRYKKIQYLCKNESFSSEFTHIFAKVSLNCHLINYILVYFTTNSLEWNV